MRSRLVLALVFTLFAATAASAQEDARELYNRATAHFNLGRYKDAAEEYQRVYEQHPDPVLLYDIAQCYRLIGDSERAIFFYKSYLRSAPKAKNRAEVEDRISDLERLQNQQRKTQSPPNETVPPKTGEQPTPPAGTTTTPPSTTAPPSSTTPPPATTTAPPPATTTAPPATTATTPTTATTETPKSETRPVYKKWWFWAAVGGAVVVVAVVVGVTVAETTGTSFKPTLPDSGPGVSAAALQVRF